MRPSVRALMRWLCCVALTSFVFNASLPAEAGKRAQVACSASNSGEAIQLTGKDEELAETLQREACQTKASYQAVDLGTLGGPSSEALAINAAGQVVGRAEVVKGTEHAFLYCNGKMYDLGALGGSHSEGFAINDRGQVVGQALIDDKENHAFLYSEGRMTDLGTLGGTSSHANGVNANGQVIGGFLLEMPHGFLYSGGKMTDIGLLPGGSSICVLEINARGQVVGFADVDGADHAVLYSDGRLSDLGTLGGTASCALDINANGQVTGSATTTAGAEHAFLYSNGEMTDLGTLGGKSSRGHLVNDVGQVVGRAQNAKGEMHAFLYSGGKMIDIGTLPGYAQSVPYGLNNTGHVICGAFRLSAAYYVFPDAVFLYHHGASRTCNARLGCHRTGKSPPWWQSMILARLSPTEGRAAVRTMHFF